MSEDLGAVIDRQMHDGVSSSLLSVHAVFASVGKRLCLVHLLRGSEQALTRPVMGRRRLGCLSHGCTSHRAAVSRHTRLARRPNAWDRWAKTPSGPSHSGWS